jgi:membrane carboxypeptidase/penicillin-binding protein
MTHMLADVVNHGTAYPARQLGFKLPAAGKTGTTNEYRDAWFVGYTPRLVTGVWIGFDQPQTIVRSGYAATVAVPLWANFMKKATEGDPADWYKAPAGIVAVQVCRLSGKRPTEACEGEYVYDSDGNMRSGTSVYTEYFVRGTQPTEECTLHERRSIFSRIAGWVGGNAAPPVQAQAPVYDRGGVAADGRAEARRNDDDDDDEREVEQPKKKRGFWARIFGRGKNDDKKEPPRRN